MSQAEGSSFNLWTEPWITLEKPDGTLAQVGIKEVLLQADGFRCLYDPSPLVVVGIHRLLTAILQDAIDPRYPSDLRYLWEAGGFPGPAIRDFESQYAHRFDLFAANEPFLQSGDLSLQPSRSARGLKPVTYLMPEFPAGTEVTHYRHGVAEENFFCPACAARGLTTVPAFATSGGAGIKPSINGVPPIYVVPGGDTLFESLASSLVLPGFQPAAASASEDVAWWRHEATVEEKAIVHEVGYLHSLTFPARRVRLHPEPMGAHERCSRCGQASDWGVQTMIYRMGESRPKDAPFWFDPFAAYRLRDKKAPVPIRPLEGKALWREFASLFLPSTKDAQDTQPPTILYQRAELAAEGIGRQYDTFPFRCVGIRTDMKAKIFEWIDAGFDVPVALIQDPTGSLKVRQALSFATDCAGIISHTFRRTFGGKGKSERYQALRRRMVSDYWSALADLFRLFVLAASNPDARETAYRDWLDSVVEQAKATFETYSEMVGDGGTALRERVTGRRICSIQLNKKRQKTLGL
jgi:CRISPR system Cascade subunit CasA